MTLADEQRRLLGTFLRARREAQPAPAAGRRRTPGLRREEVAQLCGISTTWYTWVEQGRDIALSATALARLAEALRLTAAERSYLFELALRRDPSPPGETISHPNPPELEAVLHATGAPAYILDRLWHVRAWNPPAAELFAAWFDSGERCLLRYVFLDPGAQAFIGDWEHRARRILAEFRADLAHHPEDAALRDLVAELRQKSPPFAWFWTNHAVLAREGGPRLFHHATLGTLHYQQVTLIPATHPDHKLVMLLPSDSAAPGG